jgi:hypothetical protein
MVTATKAYVMMAAGTPGATGSQLSDTTQDNFDLGAFDRDATSDIPTAIVYDQANHAFFPRLLDTELSTLIDEKEDFDSPIEMSWAGKSRKAQ